MLRELMIRHKNLIWYNQLDLCCSIKHRRKNSTKEKRAVDVRPNTPSPRLQKYENIDAGANTRKKAQ